MSNKNFFLNKLKQSVILIILFVLTIVPSTIYNSIVMQEILNEDNSNQKFISLTSNYDGEDGRITLRTFIKDEHSTYKLKNLYNNITSSNMRYHELSQNSLQFIGNFTGDTSFTVDEDPKSINVEIGEKTLTQLKTTQIGYRTLEYLDINNKLSDGRLFTSEDYDFNDSREIPLILGNSYSNIFKIGDIFQARYLGVKDLNFKVVGFLKENSKIDSFLSYPLDNRIVMPSLNIDDNLISNNLTFAGLIYTSKNSGKIAYSNDDEYNTYMSMLKKMVEKENLEWNVIGSVENHFKDNPINISKKMARNIESISLFVSILLIWVIYKLEISEYKSINNQWSSRQVLIYQTKKSIILAIQAISLNLLIYFLILKSISNPSIELLLNRTEKYMSIFYLFGFIIVNFLIGKYLKKYTKSQFKGEGLI